MCVPSSWGKLVPAATRMFSPKSLLLLASVVSIAVNSNVEAFGQGTVSQAVAEQGSNVSGWRPTSGVMERYNSADQAVANTGGSSRRSTPGGFGSTDSRASDAALAPVGGPTRARVTKGSGTLPNDQGQVWREYDIRPYTLRVTNTARPEQAIVDWILRETGYEAWHSEPVGLLSANREVLRVYHTPEMQAMVADIVDRFVNSQAEAYAFTLRVATIRNPNWRAKALPLMTPIPVQTPGVQGWLLAKEDARLLISELGRRTDYREHNATQQMVGNGQTVVLSTMRPRSYIKGAIPTHTAWPGYQPEMGQLEEGFALEFSPLLTMDLSASDAVIKLRLNQVEKMLPVKLDLPTAVTPNQRVQIDVPQLTMANLHERFRWPSDKVLLLSMGVVAAPGPSKDNPITDAVTDAVPMLKAAPRADALLFVECIPKLAPSAAPGAPVSTATLPQHSFRGRY